MVSSIPNHLPDHRHLVVRRRASVFEIHEDAWRDRDLLSRSLSDSISAALDEIRSIRFDAGVTPGFDRVFVRERFDEPLEDSAIELEDLVAGLGGQKHVFDDVQIAGSDGVIDAGFAFESRDGVVVYGTLAGSRVTSAGFAGRIQGLLERPAALFVKFLRDNGLILLDWIRAEKLE
jgi:hypothetical protein